MYLVSNVADLQLPTAYVETPTSGLILRNEGMHMMVIAHAHNHILLHH